MDNCVRRKHQNSKKFAHINKNIIKKLHIRKNIITLRGDWFKLVIQSYILTVIMKIQLTARYFVIIFYAAIVLPFVYSILNRFINGFKCRRISQQQKEIP